MKDLIPQSGDPSDLRIFGEGQGIKSQSSQLSDMIIGLLRDNYKLPDCTGFMKVGTLSATGTEASITSFTVPNGMTGVLKGFGHDAKTTDAFLYTTWRIFKNGAPLSDFGAITTQLGSVSNPKPMTERLDGGDMIEVRAITTGAAYEVYALLEGWYWSL